MKNEASNKKQATTDDASRGSSVQEMTEAALREVEEAAGAIQAGIESTPDADSFQLPTFDRPGQSAAGASAIGLLSDVELDVTVELGRTVMYVEDVLRLSESSVIELDKAAGDPVDIYVNDRHVARGEVLVLNENFCVRVSELVQPPAIEDEKSTRQEMK